MFARMAYGILKGIGWIATELDIAARLSAKGFVNQFKMDNFSDCSLMTESQVERLNKIEKSTPAS